MLAKSRATLDGKRLYVPELGIRQMSLYASDNPCVKVQHAAQERQKKHMSTVGTRHMYKDVLSIQQGWLPHLKESTHTPVSVQFVIRRLLMTI